jgi:hypothetical protein
MILTDNDLSLSLSLSQFEWAKTSPLCLSGLEC